MDFIYDNAGHPYAIVNGNATSASIYYYILNQQGDVIRILGPNNTVAATYTYNAWGEVISATGWMANQNPIRYRGYFQDNETGFYYLQSRYYDPSIGRFINADQFASTGQDFLGCNMFAYCNNNPVMHTDPTGDVWLAAGIGGAIGGAMISATSYLVNMGINGDEFSAGEFVKAVGVGAVNGFIGAAAGIIGGVAVAAASLTVGLISGTYAASQTKGSAAQKAMVGIVTGLTAAIGTSIGGLIDTNCISNAATGIVNYATTLMVGVSVEMYTVALQQTMNQAYNNTREAKPSKANKQVRKTGRYCKKAIVV